MQDRERGIPVPEEQVCQENYVTKSYDNQTEKYIPSRMECLRDYEIGIRFLSRGCVINVGCKQVAFSTIKEAMNAFTDYINDPYATRQIWEKKFQEEEN